MILHTQCTIVVRDPKVYFNLDPGSQCTKSHISMLQLFDGNFGQYFTQVLSMTWRYVMTLTQVILSRSVYTWQTFVSITVNTGDMLYDLNSTRPPLWIYSLDFTSRFVSSLSFCTCNSYIKINQEGILHLYNITCLCESTNVLRQLLCPFI